MSYLARLSKTQCLWLAGTLMVAAGIVALGWVLEPEVDELSAASFTTKMSIREIAPKLGVTGKAMAREFGFPLDVKKNQPLEKLGVKQEDLDHVVEHLISHRPKQLKYYVFAALVLWGLVFLTRLGRPDGSPNSEQETWYPRGPYIAALLVAVVVCGFMLGKSPNPMEGIVKVFKSMVGLYPSVWDKVAALLFFLGLAVVGNKLVCGWACPIGALQELLHSLPILKRAKRRKVPFWISNTIRAALLAIMLLLLFGLVGGRVGFVVYHSINPFNLFNFEFDELLVVTTIVLTLGLSLLVYRPFCQFICPFGFASWLAERFSLARVQVDRDRCDSCGECILACPSEAAEHRVAGRVFGADCYSCARCLKVCPSEAITYGSVFSPKLPCPSQDRNADRPSESP